MNPKENPEFRHATPMLNAPRRRFVMFDPKRHTEDMRDKHLPGYVEVFSHIFNGEGWAPNEEYSDAPFEETIILHPRSFQINQ